MWLISNISCPLWRDNMLTFLCNYLFELWQDWYTFWVTSHPITRISLLSCNDRLLILSHAKVNSVSKRKAQPISLAILPSFQVSFCQLHEHVSQNLGSDSHFEDLNMSKSAKCQLNQKLQHKLQIFPISFFFFQFCKKKTESLWLINGSFTTISGHFSANYIKIFHKTEVQTVTFRCFES